MIDEDIEVWKQEGYTLSDRTADGCIIFTFTGEPDAHPEDLAASGVAVEAEEDSSSDTDTVFKGDSKVQPCGKYFLNTQCNWNMSPFPSFMLIDGYPWRVSADQACSPLFQSGEQVQ